MAAPNRLDSNITSAAWSEETSFKVANGSAVWAALEPNSYSEARGDFKKVARELIAGDRQRKKGVTVDLDAQFGFNTDLTQFNIQDLLQGLFFADLRRKTEFTSTITSVTTSDDSFNVASGFTFATGDLVFARGFNTSLVPSNNGLHRATAATGTKLTSDHNLSDETPPAGAKLIKVGIQGAAGLLDVDASTGNPALVSNGTAPNWTTQGLTPGEYIWIGGDTAQTRFTNANNTCMARIRSITATRLELDKCTKTMVTEADATQTVQVFYCRFLKNENLTSLIKRRTYQIERQLGAPDDALPAQIQSEYFVGSVFNAFTMNYEQASKITCDLKFMSADKESRTAATGVKAGTHPVIENAAAQVTSLDLKRVRLAKVVAGNVNPSALYTFIDKLTLNVDNKCEPQKALTVLGAYDFAEGDFTVSGSLTGTFVAIDSELSIRNNDDCTLDVMEFQNNQGWVIDMPLLSLGGNGISVVKDKAIKAEVTFDAASGEQINANLDYTLGWSWFDYLPTVAATP